MQTNHYLCSANLRRWGFSFGAGSIVILIVKPQNEKDADVDYNQRIRILGTFNDEFRRTDVSCEPSDEDLKSMKPLSEAICNLAEQKVVRPFGWSQSDFRS